MLRIKEKNEELKEKTSMMKSQIKELKELGKTGKVWEAIEKKWIETLFNYKQQKEALNSQVEALIKENKQKEKVLTNLKLINLKSASMFNFEEIKKITTEAKIEKLVEKNKEHQRNLQQLQAQIESANERKKSLDLVCVKKRLEDYDHMLQYYTLMNTKSKMKDSNAESQEWWEVI